MWARVASSYLTRLMSSIFLSHSSKDNTIAAQVKTRLEEWGHRSIFLDFDPADGIPAGRDWEKELYAKLRECRAVIVLCSNTSMASRWCFAEIAYAKALGKEVFPIKIDATKVDPILTGKQIIDAAAGWEEAYQRLEKGLLAAGLDPKEMFDWDGTRPPYPGLPAFQEQDAAIFFGRDQEIREGLALLNRLRQFGGPRLTLVLGASGSGKSSLMYAGLLPRLKRDQRWVVVEPFRPLKAPFDHLAVAIGERFSPPSQVRDRIRWDEQDVKQSVDRFLQVTRELQGKAGAQEATVLLLIDQCEELLTIGANEEGDRFLAFLRAVLDREDSRLMVVATLRSDFLGSFQDHPVIRGLRIETVPVPQMAVDDFILVIEGPARVAGIELGSGLVQAMIHDTKTADALPLLAFTLRELYEGFGQGKRLTLKVYRDQLGRLDGCIARAADAVLSAKPLSESEASALRAALLSMVRVNDRDQHAKQPVQWSDLSASIHEVLERFVSARLLISRGDEKGRTLEVAHEALFRAWPRLVVWLQTNKAFLLWQQRLRGAIKQYEEHERKHDFLLNGFPLTEALEWLKKKLDYFSPDERQFVMASQRHKILQRLAVTAVACLMLILIGGPTTWMWKEGVTVQYATSIVLARLHAVSLAEPEMVKISGGASYRLTDGRSPRKVTISPFAIGKYEVTFEEYDRYVELAGVRSPDDATWGRGKRPVINVSWHDAKAYARWLSQASGKRYRLPTESEWEYAAGKADFWNATYKAGKLKNYAVYDTDKTEPVGEPRQANSHGLYDMIGNVWEWVEDCWHENNNDAPPDGSAWLGGGSMGRGYSNCDSRMLRGSSWQADIEGFVYAYRASNWAVFHSGGIGFRLARDIE
ncbi:MAG: hypothetical protein CV089_03975 [Nitrospira sp. WS110]|nr:hypothetical protein [Nitrospira sp. WS110]